MEQQLDFNAVMKFMKETIGEQAAEIAFLKATIAAKEKPTE
jgi:hypothetical protein